MSTFPRHDHNDGAAPSLIPAPIITRRMLTVFVIGDVLGAGIYALVGEVGGEVGGAIWSAFLLAGCSRCSPPRPTPSS